MCTLAKNHVLDWGYDGLQETLSTLRGADILCCGAGENAITAWKPAVIEIPDKECRVFIFGVGSESSGCPSDWNATEKKAGIAMVDPYDINDIPVIMNHVKKHVNEYRAQYESAKKFDKFRDIIILSIHWGGNWGFDISSYFIKFAHALIDYGVDEDDKIGIDLIHGHSSHHIKGFEIYKGKGVFYGCGDFLSDYEGINNQQHDGYNDDLSFMYFVDMDVETGNVDDLILNGSKVKQFKVNYAENKDLLWLQQTIRKECGKFGVKLYDSKDDKTLRLKEPQTNTQFVEK